jgi:DNA-binding transcriptional MerR regulator
MFTRQETIVLSGNTAGKLSYLDRKNIVCPQKIGGVGRPTCLYTWEQLLELRIIYHLRQDASLQQLRQALEYLKSEGDRESLASKTLIAMDNKIYFVANKIGEVENFLIELSGKNQGQIVLHSVLKISAIVSEIWDKAQEVKILDFESRAKDKVA